MSTSLLPRLFLSLTLCAVLAGCGSYGPRVASEQGGQVSAKYSPSKRTSPRPPEAPEEKVKTQDEQSSVSLPIAIGLVAGFSVIIPIYLGWSALAALTGQEGPVLDAL